MFPHWGSERKDHLRDSVFQDQGLLGFRACGLGFCRAKSFGGLGSRTWQKISRCKVGRLDTKSQPTQIANTLHPEQSTRVKKC